jgi:hypothetical protein
MASLVCDFQISSTLDRYKLFDAWLKSFQYSGRYIVMCNNLKVLDVESFSMQF